MNSRTKKFLSYYKPYLGWLFADLACAFIVSATALLIPLCVRYITKNMLDGISPNTVNQIYLMGIVMLLLVVVHVLSNSFVDYQGHMMGAMMESDMRHELFDHYQKLSFGFYDEQKTGQLMARLTNDSFALSELYHHGPEDIVISLLNFVGAFIILMAIDVDLALIVFLFLPIMAVYAFYFNKKMRRAMKTSKERIGDINAQIEDTLSGIRVVKSFTNEEIEKEKFSYENGRFVDSRRNEYRNEAYFFEGMTFFTQLMPIAVIIFGGVAIANLSLDLADLITFLLYIGILMEPIKRFSNFTRLYQEGITGFERFMEILELEPDIEDGDVELENVQGNIEFQNVTFKYKGNGGRVLKNFSLKIDAGEYVALVGASGVGKSTVCSLIPRFYEVNHGAILFDGINIREFRLRSLREKIGVVHQDVYLFAGSVADNIRYGQFNASREEIITAAKNANAHEFITALPNGYETDIGQRGIKLSGGQKQRLSIARVFLKNPPVLILDEATSALDNRSEAAVQNSLEKLIKNRTTIVIAHRLATIRDAQRIIVLANSGIAEQGTYSDLLARKGVFANLYKMKLRI